MILVKYVTGRPVPVSWLACPLEQYELDLFGLETGDPSGQAVWEFLAILVGLRTWAEQTQSPARSFSALVTSDSMAALQAARRLRSRCPRLNVVASELALLEALDIACIDMLSHTPGMANTLADRLSRLYVPGTALKVPPLLENVHRAMTEKRIASWWKCIPTATLHPPPPRLQPRSPAHPPLVLSGLQRGLDALANRR